MDPAGPTNGRASGLEYVLARGPQVYPQQPPPPQTQTQTQNAPAKGERHTSLMNKFLSESQGDVYNQSDGFNSMCAPQNGQAPEQQPQWRQEEHPVEADNQNASPKYGEEGFNGNEFI